MIILKTFFFSKDAINELLKEVNWNLAEIEDSNMLENVFPQNSFQYQIDNKGRVRDASCYCIC